MGIGVHFLSQALQSFYIRMKAHIMHEGGNDVMLAQLWWTQKKEQSMKWNIMMLK